MKSVKLQDIKLICRNQLFFYTLKKKSLFILFMGLCVNASLKLKIQKAKIMASSPITSWHIDGERLEKVTDFIYLFIYLFILLYFTLQYCTGFAMH